MSRTQNLLLRANMGFSSFKSRTELTFKVQVLRGFVLQHSEHAPRNVYNGLTVPSPHTKQFTLNQHYIENPNNLLHPFYQEKKIANIRCLQPDPVVLGTCYQLWLLWALGPCSTAALMFKQGFRRSTRFPDTAGLSGELSGSS